MVMIYCSKHGCKNNVDGRCESNSVTFVEVGDYEFKCQENTVRY